MAFPVEHNIEVTKERAIKGRLRDAAVDCWFTSTGRSIPHLIKFENEEGQICTLNNIRVLKSEQKMYAGILTHKYVCQTVNNDTEKEFTLAYYPDESKWKLFLVEE